MNQLIKSVEFVTDCPSFVILLFCFVIMMWWLHCLENPLMREKYYWLSANDQFGVQLNGNKMYSVFCRWPISLCVTVHSEIVRSFNDRTGQINWLPISGVFPTIDILKSFVRLYVIAKRKFIWFLLVLFKLSQSFIRQTNDALDYLMHWLWKNHGFTIPTGRLIEGDLNTPELVDKNKLNQIEKNKRFPQVTLLICF